MFCIKKGDQCPNRELTIFDTNFYIGLLNFYFDSGLTKFYRFINKVYNFFREISKFCIINRKAYLTDKLALNELNINKNSTLRKELKFFSSYNKQRHKKLIDCILKIFTRICNLNNGVLLNKLIEISTIYTKSIKLKKNSECDLSLYLLALEISKKYDKRVIIVTDDLALYCFIMDCYNNKKIILDTVNFNTEKVISIINLLYFLKLYECGQIDYFEALWDYLEEYYRTRSNIDNIRIRLDFNKEIGKELAKSRKIRDSIIIGGI